jgi:hypothetical protein
VVASVTLDVEGTAPAADETDRSTLEGYARWANGALAALPQGSRLLQPLAERLAQLTSARRHKAGLAPLEADQELLPAARAHALDVLERGYVGHVTPGGLDPASAWRFCTGAWSVASARTSPSCKVLPQNGSKVSLGRSPPSSWLAGCRALATARTSSTRPIRISRSRRPPGARLWSWCSCSRHAKALLAEPLPLHVGQGKTLALAFEQPEGLAVPAQYAYARPDQPAQELVTLDLSSDEVPVEPGAYVLTFLLASGQAGRFEVVGGPAILVQ